MKTAGDSLQGRGVRELSVRYLGLIFLEKGIT
jgi:hypothetical protein